MEELFKVMTTEIQWQAEHKGLRMYYVFCDWKTPVYGKFKNRIYTYHQKTALDLLWLPSERVYIYKRTLQDFFTVKSSSQLYC